MTLCRPVVVRLIVCVWCDPVQSVVGHEDEELDDDDYATKAYEVRTSGDHSTCRYNYMRNHVTNVGHITCSLPQLYSQHKAELVHKQGQLADRGAHSMVLLVVTATQGELAVVH